MLGSCLAVIASTLHAQTPDPAVLQGSLTDPAHAFFRACPDLFYDPNPNGIVGEASLANAARVFHRRTYSVAAGDTAVLSPGLVNNLRAQSRLASRSKPPHAWSASNA